MTLEQIEAKIAAMTAQYATIQKKIRPLEKRREWLHERIASLAEKRDAIRLAEADPNVFDWELIMFNGATQETKVRYDERRRQIEKLGLHYGGGYWTDTRQTALSIALKKGDSAKTRQIQSAIEQVLPHMKPGENGHRRFKLFEATLSEDGVYEFAVLSDGTVLVLLTRRFHTKTLKTFADIATALRYCEQNHYYDVLECAS